MMKLMIIWGSSRRGRKGGIVASWIKNSAGSDERFEVDFVDLADLSLPMFDEAKNPSNMESLAEYTNAQGKSWAQRVEKAEAYILITPEYNYSFSAVLKNALDWVGLPWDEKPVGLIGYGGVVGGARAVEQLRNVVTSLGMNQVSRSLYFPYFEEAFDENGQPKRLDYYEANIKKMFDSIVRLHKLLQSQ